MKVIDVYEDAREVLGIANQVKIFSRLTDAIEALANKGSWEPLLAYLSIATNQGFYVDLPDTVEAPIRVNIDNNPSFPRDKMWEFTMNSPGLNDTAVDWSWFDQGETATVNAETGLVTRLNHRRIKLSKSGAAVRMLVRLKTTTITTLDQFIPLHSKISILIMLKALESYRKGNPQDFQLGQAQEEQALKFLQAEQASRNVFSEMSKVIDATPIVGYTYHSGNSVIVADIYDAASVICGGVGKQHVLDSISEAIEVLANKSQWDATTAYLDIVPYGNKDLIWLPRIAEIPLRININKQPAVARDRMFEFSLNGPGTDLSDVEILTWVDQGTTFTMLPLTEPSRLFVVSQATDIGKQITIWGTDNADQEANETITIGQRTDSQENIPTPPNTVTGGNVVFKSISRVQKDVTAAPILLQDAFQNNLSLYYPDEREPVYRQIKLNKPADEVKVMFRKASPKVTSVYDLIPLKSRMAVLLMLRSLQLLKAPNLTSESIVSAQHLDDLATKMLQAEETSRLGYIQSASNEQFPALGSSTNSRNVVLVKDLYDDAADIFGPIGRIRLLDAITDAEELLANKSQWDGLDGYVDIVTDQRGYATLPRKVEVPVAINYYRTPAAMRSRWYEFNIDGFAGCDPGGYYWDDLGEYPIMVEPANPSFLFAITRLEADTNKLIRAYGYDSNGNWIKSTEDGQPIDGERVPVNYVPDNQNPPLMTTTEHTFRTITRITKDITNNPIELWGNKPLWDTSDTDFPHPLPPTPTPYLLSIYEQDEVEPMYRRIKIPTWVKWLRMRYRKMSLKITSMNDFINLRSKLSVVIAMQAIKKLNDGDVAAADALEKKAVQLISEEQMSRNPSEVFSLQFDTRTSWADPLQGIV